MTETRATFVVSIQLIGDFDAMPITFYRPTNGQLAMLARGAGMAQRSPNRAVRGVAQILDVIDALIVDPEQRDWLTESMIQGVVDLDSLSSILAEMNEDAETPAKAPVKAVRRGRP